MIKFLYLCFDLDDIMNVNFIEVLMQESKFDNIDKNWFKMENFWIFFRKEMGIWPIFIKTLGF